MGVSCKSGEAPVGSKRVGGSGSPLEGGVASLTRVLAAERFWLLLLPPAFEFEFGALVLGVTVSTSWLRSWVLNLVLCLPRMWSLRVSFRE